MLQEKAMEERELTSPGKDRDPPIGKHPFHGALFRKLCARRACRRGHVGI